jgi:hypothetical protein
MSKWKAMASAIALTCCVAGTGAAMATPVGLNGPIDSFGPPFGSSHETSLENFLDSYYGTTGISFLGRLDNSGSDFTGSPLSGLGVTLTGTGLGSTSGTWTLTENLGLGPAWNVLAIEINAASNGLLYDVNPIGLDSSACSVLGSIYSCTGSWNTFDITVGHGNHPALSHIDLYGIDPPLNNSVPEPATLALFGTGLAALWSKRRRRGAKASV